jgi:hypothetical protein
MQGHKEISRNLDKDIYLMDSYEWTKFGTHTNLVPHVMNSEEFNSIFRILQREAMEEEKKGEDENLLLKAKIGFKLW